MLAANQVTVSRQMDDAASFINQTRLELETMLNTSFGLRPKLNALVATWEGNGDEMTGASESLRQAGVNLLSIAHSRANEIIEQAQADADSKFVGAKAEIDSTVVDLIGKMNQIIVA